MYTEKYHVGIYKKKSSTITFMNNLYKNTNEVQVPVLYKSEKYSKINLVIARSTPIIGKIH